ncbi:histone deacetylase [Streptomyces sp. SID3343]|nr:histone deacetylase [Streptomyces sp. SID3343]MYV98187.1 histone deacetylase [Streptomyces sp. SID3343]
MHGERFDHYLRGGRPEHGARTYPGCRDRTPPRRTAPVRLPGRMYFALESLVWTGGLALYDPLDPGETLARAYLLTTDQFTDVAAQEMHRPPGAAVSLTAAIEHGTATLGPGRYETLISPGRLDGHPLLTFTAPWRSETTVWTAPSAPYLRHLAQGLIETHAHTPTQAATYLATRPGAAGTWTTNAIESLLPTTRTT